MTPSPTSSSSRPGIAPLQSIRVRILLPVLAAMLTMGFAMGFLVVQVQSLSHSMAIITDGYLPLKEVVARLERYHQRIDNDLARLRADAPRPGTGTSSPTVIYTSALKEDLARARARVGTARTISRSPPERAALAKVDLQLTQIEGLFRNYQSNANTYVQLAESGQREQAQRLAEPLASDARKLAQELDTVDRLLDGRIETLTQSVAQARTYATAVAATLTLLAFLLLTAAVFAVFYASRPISRLTEQVQRLAAGDYSGQVQVAARDEIGVLASEFNAMVEALRRRDRTLVDQNLELERLSGYLGSVLDSLDEGLVVVELGEVTLANPAARRIWQAQPGSACPAPLRQILQEPGSHDLNGPDHSRHAVRVTRFGDTGVVITSQDVTAQLRSQERLARSERLALIGQMLAQITHEVRNPLNAMSLNAELLNEELESLDSTHSSEAWEILEVLSAEVERLTAVTGHYLQLARRPRAHLAPHTLSDLVHGVARLLEAELEQQQVSLELTLDDPGSQSVDGDQLRQALLNILRNAVEAGASELQLSLSHDHAQVRLELKDNGPGMRDEEVERAFDPFWSTKAQGTGLGLAITRQIVEDHDGTVQVQSDPDRRRGTTFVLTFPRRDAARSEFS